MKLIKLNEIEVMVDDEDYEFVTSFYNLYIYSGYIHCEVKKKYKHMALFEKLQLHKLIIQPEKLGRNIVVDHIDGNKLNNQKSNLRICSHAENMRNRKVTQFFAGEETSSKYKGVYYHIKNKAWQAHIGVNKKLVYLGCFRTEVAAANCYNYYSKEYHGEYGLQNDCPIMDYEEWMAQKIMKETASEYRGVSLDSSGKYVAQIYHDKRNIVIGRFVNEEEAARAYDQKAIQFKGIDKAKLNFSIQ